MIRFLSIYFDLSFLHLQVYFNPNYILLAEKEILEIPLHVFYTFGQIYRRLLTTSFVILQILDAP